MARVFATTIGNKPSRYAVSETDCATLSQRVREFRDALAKAMSRSTRTPSATSLMKEARQRLEEIVRRLGREIRANGRIADGDKLLVRIKPPKKKLSKREGPFAAPYLSYMGTPNRAGPNSGLHQLHFSEAYAFINKSKPNGAVRIELFVDLVAPGQPIPQFPGQYLGGRPWYLRSFSRSPFKVRHPMPPVPMLVVYWARWADARGNVGPFSQTCVTRSEGYSSTGADKLLGPPPDVKQLANDPKYITTITQLRQFGQVKVERMLPEAQDRALPAPAPERKQLPLDEAA
jgi:hypothetical protein